MATCAQVITYAMQLCRIIGPGKSPKAAETTEGMIALQSLYDGWRTGGMFGRLEDVYLEEDDVAEEGVRYFVPTGFTLTAPTSVYQDWVGTTRQPLDLAVYEALTQAGVQTAMIYDRTAWVNLLGLVSSDTAPLSGRDAYGLAACLAISAPFIPVFGADPGPMVAGKAAQFTRGLSGKTGSTQNKSVGSYF